MTARSLGGCTMLLKSATFFMLSLAVALFASDARVSAQQSDAGALSPPLAQNIARFALVVGNSGYLNLPKLRNPANDARSISDSLHQIGFHTRLVLDASEH